MTLPFTFFACSDNTGNEETQNQDASFVEVTDSIEVESKNNDDSKFVFFEDYQIIKSRKDLENNFSKEELSETTSFYGEGSYEAKTTVITNKENGQIVRLMWRENAPDSVDFIEADYFIYDQDYVLLGKQKIESVDGLYLGMPLSELAIWNKEDVQFSGFGWDFSGGIFPGKNGRLNASKIKINLGLDSEEMFDGLIGDIELSSSQEIVKKAPIVVEQMTIYYER